MMCYSKDMRKKTYYDLDTSGEDWAQMNVNECVAILEDLDFACAYTVELLTSNTNQVS